MDKSICAFCNKPIEFDFSDVNRANIRGINLEDGTYDYQIFCPDCKKWSYYEEVMK